MRNLLILSLYRMCFTFLIQCLKKICKNLFLGEANISNIELNVEQPLPIPSSILTPPFNFYLNDDSRVAKMSLYYHGLQDSVGR